MPFPSSATSGFGTLLKRGDNGVGAGVAAFVEWGTSNQKIRIKRAVAGTAGNGKNITVVVSGSTYVITTLTADAISITVPTTATVAAVVAFLYQNETFQANWDADYGAVPGDGTGTITARTVTPTASGTNGTEIFSTVAEVKNLSGPNMAAAVIDVTNMDSQNNTREFITSLVDPGEMSFTLNFLPGNVGQQDIINDLKNRTRRNYQLVWTDSANTTWNFAGLVTSFQPSSATEESLMASVTIKVTGFPTWT